MGKDYSPTGEESLREMIRLEGERRRHLTVGNRYGNVDGRSSSIERRLLPGIQATAGRKAAR